MTDEERQKLCEGLHLWRTGTVLQVDAVCKQAADEIERLAALADAEPGILHNKEAGFKEAVTRDTAAIYDNNPQARLVEEIFDFDRQLIGFRVYDAPPRPDASAGLIEAAKRREEELREDERLGAALRRAQDAEDRLAASAGLIEAAECLEANRTKWGASSSPCVMSVAKWLRARAADRTGK